MTIRTWEIRYKLQQQGKYFFRRVDAVYQHEANKIFDDEINRYSFNWTSGGQFSKKKIGEVLEEKEETQVEYFQMIGLENIVQKQSRVILKL